MLLPPFASTVLDPADPEASVSRLQDLRDDWQNQMIDQLDRVIARFSEPASVFINRYKKTACSNITFVNKFSFSYNPDFVENFGTQMGALELYGVDPETVVTGVISILLKQRGFLNLTGNEDWIETFTRGAWKIVINRLRKQMELEMLKTPYWCIGFRNPRQQTILEPNPAPFIQAVSRYDKGSFQQMMVLAAMGDQMKVYFPRETLHDVRMVYIEAREAMRITADGIDLDDSDTFNARLSEQVDAIAHKFNPRKLRAPRPKNDAGHFYALSHLSRSVARHGNWMDDALYDARHPFEAFVNEELFPDENSSPKRLRKPPET